jgi:hypothetical protein
MGTTEKRIAILNQMYKNKVTVTVQDAFGHDEHHPDCGTKVELILRKDR